MCLDCFLPQMDPKGSHCIHPRQGLLWHGVWYFMVTILHLLPTSIVVLWLCRGRPEFEMWCIRGTLHRSAGAPTPAAPLSQFLPPIGIHGLWSASCPICCTHLTCCTPLKFALQAGCIPTTSARGMTSCAATVCHVYCRQASVLHLGPHTVGTATAWITAPDK